MKISIKETYHPTDMIMVRGVLEEYLKWVNNCLVENGLISDSGKGWLQRLELENLPGVYNLPKGAILVAQYGEKIVGTIFLHQLDSTTAEIKRLYVVPAFRKNGMALKLITLIAEKAVYRGFQHIRISTHEFMKPAINLYMQLGFENCNAYHDDPLQGNIFMEVPVKRLLSYADFHFNRNTPSEVIN